MNIETEKKFLVLDDGFKAQAVKSYRIRQGYLAHDSGRTVRVRIRDDKGFLTIKGPSIIPGSRPEWEKEISLQEAEDLFALCKPGSVDKTRWIVPAGIRKFEVDEFHGENDGLVMAEIELGSPDEPFERPSWLDDVAQFLRREGRENHACRSRADAAHGLQQKKQRAFVPGGKSPQLIGVFADALRDIKFHDALFALQRTEGVEGDAHTVAHAVAVYHSFRRLQICQFSFEIFNHSFFFFNGKVTIFFSTGKRKCSDAGRKKKKNRAKGGLSEKIVVPLHKIC